MCDLLTVMPRKNLCTPAAPVLSGGVPSKQFKIGVADSSAAIIVANFNACTSDVYTLVQSGALPTGVTVAIVPPTRTTDGNYAVTYTYDGDPGAVAGDYPITYKATGAQGDTNTLSVDTKLVVTP